MPTALAISSMLLSAYPWERNSSAETLMISGKRETGSARLRALGATRKSGRPEPAPSTGVAGDAVGVRRSGSVRLDRPVGGVGEAFEGVMMRAKLGRSPRDRQPLRLLLANRSFGG